MNYFCLTIFSFEMGHRKKPVCMSGMLPLYFFNKSCLPFNCVICMNTNRHHIYLQFLSKILYIIVIINKSSNDLQCKMAVLAIIKHYVIENLIPIFILGDGSSQLMY